MRHACSKHSFLNELRGGANEEARAHGKAALKLALAL